MQIYAVTRRWPGVTHERLASAVRAAGRAHPSLRDSPVVSSAEGVDLCLAAVAHGRQFSAPRVYRAHRDGVTVLFDGRPVDRRGEFVINDAAELMERWQQAAERLEGVFSAVRVDARTGEVECLLDVLGMAQVYVARSGPAWALSNSVEVLRCIGCLERPDALGVSSLLTLGWVAGDRTLLEGVEVLPGGHLHRLGSEHTASATLTPATVVPRRTAAPRPVTEVAAAMIRMTAAAADGLRPVMCGLTAGRDSRVVLALAMRAGLAVECFTSTATNQTDVRIAVDLARRLALSHRTVKPSAPADASDWARQTSAFVTQTDGLASLWGVADWVEHQAPVNRLGLKLWGAGGEIGRSAMTGIGTPFAANAPGFSRSWRAQKWFLDHKTARWQGLVTEAGAEPTRMYLRDYVDRRRHEGWRANEVLESYYAFERVKHWAAAGIRRSREATDVFAPFVCRDYIDYCYALGAGHRYLEIPHHALLSTLSPQLRDLPFDAGWRRQRPRMAPLYAIGQAGAWALRRATPSRRAVSGPSFGQRWYEAGSSLHRELALSFPQSPLWDYVDRRRFEHLVARPAGPDVEGLCRVLTAFWYFHARHAGGGQAQSRRPR